VLEDAARFGIGPPVLSADPLRGRLLVRAPEADREALLEILAFVDAPTPQVLLRLSLVETVCTDRAETGGHALFDRDVAGNRTDTLFRSVDLAFEPDSFLRRTLFGHAPFPGVSAALGDPAEGFSAVLRALAHRGEAEIHLSPSLLLTEGVPGKVEATVELPETVFTGSEVAITATPVREKAGVSVEAVAERVGTDHVVVAVKAWLRQVTAGEAEGGPAGYPVLSTREITARATVRDGRTVVLGGFGSFERTSSRRGLPALARFPLLDAVASARRRTSARTEFLVVATPVVRVPGRPLAAVPRSLCPPCRAVPGQTAPPKPPPDS
jgi:type II secretory pathway component GspD/PulD (secretin)